MTESSMDLAELILEFVPADGAPIGNISLRQWLSDRLGREVLEDEYAATRDALVVDGLLARGAGRGGSVRRATAETPAAFDLAPQATPDVSAETRKPARRKKKAAAGRKSRSAEAEVVSYRHQDTRINNPPVGLVTPDTDPVQPATR